MHFNNDSATTSRPSSRSLLPRLVEHCCLQSSSPSSALTSPSPAPTLPTSTQALLENNFEDYASIRSDPDLAPVRGPELDKLLSK